MTLNIEASIAAHNALVRAETGNLEVGDLELLFPDSVHQEEIRGLLANDRLSRRDLERLVELTGLRGELPAPTGHRLGRPWWSKAAFTEWANHTAIHTRAAVLERREYTRRAAPPTLPGESTRASIRSRSYSAKDRTFLAVATTETPVPQFDFWSGGVVREVLLADGGVWPNRFPLLTDHERTTGTTIGSGSDSRLEGSQWVVFCRLAADRLALDIGQKIDDGHLDAVSVGYRIHEYIDIQPGLEEVISGRLFKNTFNVPLRIVTRWEVFELSVVPVGADPNARIRGAASLGERSMPAIQSRDSITHQHTVGELVSAALMGVGVSDPSVCRYARSSAGAHVRIEPGLQTERDADGGRNLSRYSWTELAVRAAMLDGAAFKDPDGRIEVLRQHSQRSGGMSTANLDSFFENTVASLVLSRWDAQGDSTAGWCEEIDLPTTRRTSHVQLTGAPQLTKHVRGGQADQSTFEASDEENRLTAYSTMFKLDEQDWLDGEAGDIAKAILRQFVDAARALRPTLVYGLLLRNPTMSDGTALFHADHGNLNFSAALADAKLAASMAAIAKQEEHGVKLNLRGQYVIVPEVLERPGAKLIREVELLDPSQYRAPILRTDSRLDNGFTDPLTDVEHAGDASTWFNAAADGAHGIQVAYREGDNRKPQTRITYLQQGYFGVCVDVRHCLGVMARGWRGLQKNVSAAS